MTKKDLQREYIKEFGYPKFNKYNNNDYTKWLETKLIETEKQCAINGVVDSCVDKDTLIEDLDDKRVVGVKMTDDMWYYSRKETAEHLLDKYNVIPK